jgi:hypothetical protein
MPRDFRVSVSIVKEILIHILGFRKYEQKYVPHLLDAVQKNDRWLSATELLKGRLP